MTTYHAQLCYKHYDPASEKMGIAVHPYMGLRHTPQVNISDGLVSVYIGSDMFYLTLDSFISMAIEEEQATVGEEK